MIARCDVWDCTKHDITMANGTAEGRVSICAKVGKEETRLGSGGRQYALSVVLFVVI